MNQWIRWDTDAGAAEPSWRWLANALAMPALLLTPARARADITLPASRLAETSREKFTALLGEQGVREDKDSRLAHGARGTAADRLRLRAGLVSNVPDAVLVPRNRDDVLAILRICAEDGIAVTASSDRLHVAINLARMDRLLSVDFMSGLAEVEAGIASSELARQLAARGLMLSADSFATLGDYIAHHDAPWLYDMKVATPRGLVPTPRKLPGIITSAAVRVRAMPTASEQRHYLFPDFAAGLAALHEAERLGLALHDAQLSDAAQTRFTARMAGARQSLWRRLEDIYRQVRRLDDQACALTVTFTGSDISLHRKRFDALAARLGALVRALPQPGDDSDALMDRGVTVDSIQAFATWSHLPVLYSTARVAMDQAMRQQSPRAGAHGLVLAQVSNVGADGAQLRLTMIFPRVLGDGVAQAQAIRDVAEKAFAGPEPALLETQLHQAIRQVLDPKGILA